MSALKTAYPDLPAPESPPPVFSLADLGSFKEQMLAGGFETVEVDYVTRDVQVDSFEDLWNMFTVGAPPIQVLFDRVGSDSRERTRDELAKIVEERFGNGPIRISNAATVGVGTVS